MEVLSGNTLCNKVGVMLRVTEIKTFSAKWPQKNGGLECVWRG